MASDFDPYRILGVDASARPEDVEAAYERLRRAVEADGGGAGERRQRELRTAYALLRDPEQRRAYDQRLSDRAARIAAGEWPAVTAEGEAQAGRAPWGWGDMLKAIGIVLLGTLAISLPVALLASAVAGGSGKIDTDPEALALALAASLFLELFLLGSALYFSVVKYHLRLPALGLRLPIRGGWLLPIGLVMASLAVIYVYFGILSAFGVNPSTDVPKEAFHNAAPVVVLGILSLVFAPVMEEIFFRGFIFGGLRGRLGTPLAAVASGLLFGLAHVGNAGSFWVVPPIAAVGVIFALGYVYSGSLTTTMAAHFLFNLVSFVVGIATS